MSTAQTAKRKAAKSKKSIRDKVFQKSVSVERSYDDNSLAISLFGSHHTHLARVEQKLDVIIHARGNKLTISGLIEDVNSACQVFEGLHERLEKKMPLDLAEVDAAIRMVQSPKGDVADSNATVRTPNRHGLPRRRRELEREILFEEPVEGQDHADHPNKQQQHRRNL